MNTPVRPPHLLYVLTIEPASADGDWRASLVRVPPTPSSPGAVQVFDSPLELARYVAQVSMPPSPAGGLR